MMISLDQVLPQFQSLYPQIELKSPLATEGLSILTQPLLIIVGLTGVGKTTILNALKKTGFQFTLLPNRRHITDDVIIPTVTQRQGTKTLCRIERLNYTRQFRQRFSGGMAYALSLLKVHSSVTFPLIFDGLRGENEVTYAAKTFKNAQFILLDAPDSLRLERLLIRQDVFDQINTSALTENKLDTQAINPFAAFGLPEAADLFSTDEQQKILAQLHQGLFSVTDLQNKLKIVLEERQNYHPLTTKIALQTLAPERTLIMDTTTQTPEQIAQNIIFQLKP